MKANFAGFVDEKYEPYTVQPGAVPRRPELDPAGLPDVRAACDREGGRLQARRLAARRPGLRALLDHHRDHEALVDANKDVAKRFVEASIIGWYNYLYGDNAAANALIKTDNPEMTDEQIAYWHREDEGVRHRRLRRRRDQGHRLHDRRALEVATTTRMVEIGLFEAGIDITQAYTTEFVCQGLGMDLVK